MYSCKLAFYKAEYATIDPDNKDRLINASKPIGVWTKGPYSHVELVIPLELVTDKHLDVLKVASYIYNNKITKKPKTLDINTLSINVPEDVTHVQLTSSGTYGGVRITFHKLDKVKYDYIDIDIFNIDNVLEFFLSILPSRYDYFGILGFVLPTQDRRDLWFCSECIANALKIDGNPLLWSRDPSNTSPNDLAEIVRLLNNRPSMYYMAKKLLFNKEYISSNFH